MNNKTITLQLSGGPYQFIFDGVKLNIPGLYTLFDRL